MHIDRCMCFNKNKEDMTHVKVIRENALETCLKNIDNRLSVKLSNFKSCQATKGK